MVGTSARPPPPGSSDICALIKLLPLVCCIIAAVQIGNLRALQMTPPGAPWKSAATARRWSELRNVNEGCGRRTGDKVAYQGLDRRPEDYTTSLSFPSDTCGSGTDSLYAQGMLTPAPGDLASISKPVSRCSQSVLTLAMSNHVDLSRLGLWSEMHN